MKKKILLVEDDEKVVDMVKFRLQANSYDVEVAYDGEEGLAKAISFKPDLILLDLMLPKKEGLEVLRDLRMSDSSLREVTVIILSALKDTSKIIKAEELGAVDYIMKPYEVKDLLELIKKYILH